MVCQNRTCLKQGSAEVLTAFQKNDIPNCTVSGSGCMGQCGSGPMVKVLPDEVWYSRVNPLEVPFLIERHLLKGHPVQAMLYPKFHPI